MIQLATGDFETRSEADLRKVGGWIYSKHPSTEAMCFAYRLPHWEEGKTKLWHRAHTEHLIDESETPVDLFQAIANGMPFEAHNAFFEYSIWNNVMVPRYDWPAIPEDQWRCSAAKASVQALPRKLGDACEILDLIQQKDDGGHKLMLKMCKPRQPRKAEVEAWMEEVSWDGKFSDAKKAMPAVWHETEEDIYRQWEYCRQDVLAEEALSHFTPELSDYELKVWQADQKINRRGVKVDVDLCAAALEIADAWKKKLNGELHQMTGIDKGTKRAAIRAWLKEHEDLELVDTTADTLEWSIANLDLSGRARRVLEITMDVNRTSTRKYTTMLRMADPDDDRVRDHMRYCGAERTGRWAGAGIQVHNFPARDLIVKDMAEAREAIKSRNVDWCEALYGDVMKLLSHTLRGAIIPSTGRRFAIADYAAIEARVILWLADATEALQVFYRGEDIYCDMASGIYGYPVAKATHHAERQFGKQAILGLGFGMGWLTFLLTCKKYDIKFSRKQVHDIMGPENLDKYESWVNLQLFPTRSMFVGKDKKDFTKAKQAAGKNLRRLTEKRLVPKELVHELALMKYTVDVYRNRYPEVKAIWSDLEKAAVKCVKTGETVECGKVTCYMDGRFFKIKLPSGRSLAYLDPKISMKKTPWGEDRGHLSYVGPHPTTKKPTRIGTYGGKLVENITQATARDAMADALVNADEDEIYDPVMSVHDELVSEVDEGLEDEERYGNLMGTVGAWAKGCPIEAEAEFADQYKK